MSVTVTRHECFNTLLFPWQLSLYCCWLVLAIVSLLLRWFVYCNIGSDQCLQADCKLSHLLRSVELGNGMSETKASNVNRRAWSILLRKHPVGSWGGCPGDHSPLVPSFLSVFCSSSRRCDHLVCSLSLASLDWSCHKCRLAESLLPSWQSLWHLFVFDLCIDVWQTRHASID